MIDEDTANSTRSFNFQGSRYSMLVLYFALMLIDHALEWRVTLSLRFGRTGGSLCLKKSLDPTVPSPQLLISMTESQSPLRALWLHPYIQYGTGLTIDILVVTTIQAPKAAGAYTTQCRKRRELAAARADN